MLLPAGARPSPRLARCPVSALPRLQALVELPGKFKTVEAWADSLYDEVCRVVCVGGNAAASAPVPLR